MAEAEAEAKEVFLKNPPGGEKVQEGTLIKREDEGDYIATCALCGQQFLGKSKEAKELLDTHFTSSHTTMMG